MKNNLDILIEAGMAKPEDMDKTLDRVELVDSLEEAVDGRPDCGGGGQRKRPVKKGRVRTGR
jgi:hypothetical protein